MKQLAYHNYYVAYTSGFVFNLADNVSSLLDELNHWPDSKSGVLSSL